MREGLAAHRDIGAEVLVPAFLALVAEAHEKLGQPAEGLSAVSEALAGAAIRAALLGGGAPSAERCADAGRPDAAESYFLRGHRRSRSRQRAKSLELRAATSLSRLWAEQGKVSGAHGVLSGVYDWFTEGFDTADLSDAKSLLEALETRR